MLGLGQGYSCMLSQGGGGESLWQERQRPLLLLWAETEVVQGQRLAPAADLGTTIQPTGAVPLPRWLLSEPRVPQEQCEISG